MANEIITTLHPDQDPNTNLYPNIKKENIPNGSVDIDKLDPNYVNDVNNKINNLGDDLNNLEGGSPKYVDISTNILALTENKGVAVAIDNGHWYYWTGTQYADGGVYQGIALYDDSVHRNNLDDDLKLNTDGGIKGNKLFNYFNINGNLIPYGVLLNKTGHYAYNDNGVIKISVNLSYNVYKIDYKSNIDIFTEFNFRFIDIVDIDDNVLIEYTNENNFNTGNYVNGKYIYLTLYSDVDQIISIDELKIDQNNFISPIFINKFKTNNIKVNTNLIPYDVVEYTHGKYAYKDNGTGKITFSSSGSYDVYKIKYKSNINYYSSFIRFFDVVDESDNVLLEAQEQTTINSSNFSNGAYIYVTIYSTNNVLIENYNTTPFINVPTSAKKISISTSCVIGDPYLKLNLINQNQDIVNYVNVTSTELIVWSVNFGSPTETRINHNLTITNNIQLNVDIINGSGCNITLISNGEEFEWSTDFNKMQVTFLSVDVSNATDLSISYAINEILKDNWIFGDSYVSTSNERWIYYLYGSNYNNYLVDGYSGENSPNSLISLKTLLKTYTPKNVCWFLGMNDGGDTDLSTPSSSWLNALNEVIELSKVYGFNLILSTTPTVPSVYNEGKNYYVRNSRLQYVDFARSVGADSNGNWFTGMLSADNVHPTSKGAIALYGQFINDFPQIKINK